MEQDSDKRLVVVSNRLPVALKKVDGEWTLTPGSGGLVSAMAPVLQNRGGTWVGWNGTAGGDDTREILANFSKSAGYNLQPVLLTQEEVDKYYLGFTNEAIWPLFHDLQGRSRFHPDHWHTYLDVNHKFALEVAGVSAEEDMVWIHDYHLMHVAWTLKQLGLKRKTAFFLHIPFPSPDILLKLPWRAKIIQALLAHDLVGFQSMRDRRNYANCVKLFFPEAKTRGRGAVITISLGNHVQRIGSFPIGIDYKVYNSAAASKKGAARARELRDSLKASTIALGVDRLDYTKGIPERLYAMRRAFETYPELVGKLSLIQVAVPSRTEVAAYKELRIWIERLVGEINGLFGYPGYVPVHYMYRGLGRDELCAYYRAADMALVTPLRDGMNLVAKEYVACNVERRGVLFLSEFAGAAAQLQGGAILVNPHDVEGMARSIWKAYRMSPEEKEQRMRRMQENVRKQDIYWWVDSFLHAGFAKHIGDFPFTDTDGVDYSPYGAQAAF